MSFSASVAELVLNSGSPLVEAAPSWVRVKLGDVAAILNGYPWKSTYFNDKVGEPVIRIRDVTSGSTETKYLGEIVDGYWIENGNLLIGMDGEFNVRVWGGGRALLNQRVCRITTDNCHYLPELLAHILPAYLQLIHDETHSITVKHLSSKTLAEIPLPLPPLPEQRRIVAKIDSLTGKSRRARDHLNHIPRLVEKYKQAVLAAAFRGELTREWRVNRHPLTSPANILREIEGIRSSLAATTSRSKAPRDEAAAGSRIAVALGTIPDSWALTTLENVTDPTRVIQYGILKPGPNVEDGVPYVKVMNIRDGRINLDTVRKTSVVIHKQYRRSSIREGDILLTIRGTVGRLAFVPTDLNGGNITQDSVRIAVLPVVNPRYVYWFLLGPLAQRYFKANQKGVAVRGINVGDVRPMELPLPSTEEQDEVVQRIEAAFVWIDRLASEATSGRKLIDRLDQAVLAKAFRGELVPQDPEDEPASVLLERIKAERDAASKTTRGRRTRRTA